MRVASDAGFTGAGRTANPRSELKKRLQFAKGHLNASALGECFRGRFPSPTVRTETDIASTVPIAFAACNATRPPNL